MAMSNALKAKIGNSMTLLERFNALVVENYEATLPAAVQQILDALPYEIAEANLLGLNYAVAMPLREGVDFSEPSRIERFRSKKPKVEILRGTAKAVFGYCLDNGLQPELALYEKAADGKLTSEISIQWSSQLLQECPTRSVVDGSFLQKLKDQHRDSDQPQQLMIRSRLSGAIEKLPKMLRDIELAALRGASSWTVHSQLVPTYLCTADQLPDLTADLKAFCEMLGLTTDVRRHHGSVSSLGNVNGFDLTVSGWVKE